MKTAQEAYAKNDDNEQWYCPVCSQAGPANPAAALPAAVPEAAPVAEEAAHVVEVRRAVDSDQQHWDIDFRQLIRDNKRLAVRQSLDLSRFSRLAKEVKDKELLATCARLLAEFIRCMNKRFAKYWHLLEAASMIDPRLECRMRNKPNVQQYITALLIAFPINRERQLLYAADSESIQNSAAAFFNLNSSSEHYHH